MANRLFQQFLHSFIRGLTFIEGGFTVGATGAVGSLHGSGIKSVTRLAVGTYKITFDDKFNRLLNSIFNLKAPVTGAAVASAALGAGSTYEIVSLGNSDWNSFGIPAGVTPAVGMPLVVLGNGAGSGTAKAVAATAGAPDIEIVGDPQLTINCPVPHIIIQCATAGTVTELVEGSKVLFGFNLRNSSVKGKGE